MRLISFLSFIYHMRAFHSNHNLKFCFVINHYHHHRHHIVRISRTGIKSRLAFSRRLPQKKIFYLFWAEIKPQHRTVGLFNFQRSRNPHNVCRPKGSHMRNGGLRCRSHSAMSHMPEAGHPGFVLLHADMLQGFLEAAQGAPRFD